ncbi:hypothetical protein JT065_06650 [Helicobacter pylori]|nr:hypothetical protein [Helicobacter pylori]
MGMGLYGGEKIKRLTRERERESGFLRIIAVTNSWRHLMVCIILDFSQSKLKKLKNIKELDFNQTITSWKKAEIKDIEIQ